MELFAADGHDAGGCERVTGKSGMRPELEEVEPAGSRSLSDYMSGLLVFYLLEVGCSDEAAQVWRDRGLPTAIPELVDLERQP